MTAISVEENNVNTKLEECFGKSHYFLLASPKTNQYEFIINPGVKSIKMSGVKAAKFLVKCGVKTVISSNFGVSVKKIFDKNKVQIVILSKKYNFLKDIEWFNKLIEK
jgi:predicted Fe-Mo cluster-binding NifX family protein